MADMTVRRMDYLNPLYRWRWDAAGMFGYAVTKRAACRAARQALAAAHFGDKEQ